MNRPIDSAFFDFINETVLPLTDLNQAVFWQDLNQLLSDFGPANRKLLATRTSIQGQIDEWQAAHIGQPMDLSQYQSFLEDIGYLQTQRSDFSITTDNVDPEISTMAGPQLVVPINNARFALNAANARWGSLF
ncbi:MAG: malate synthase G, partial [Psychrosphaera sp.]|nr:malate synthase G [Psychrosphaera sp.]